VAAEKVRARRRGRMRPIVLAVDALADPGNLGTLLRAALAADADEALLSTGCADPYAPKVVRAGAGAHFLLPIRAGLAWEEIARRLRGSPPVHQILLAEADASTPYFAADLAARTGLIVSNEAHGPSAGASKLATQRIAIPMYNKVESLNAAVAGSVILFEATRQRRLTEERKTATEQSATAEQPIEQPNEE
jgi:RNA methyltransferase, TrmH family